MQQVDPKRNIKENIKERGAGSGRGVERAQIAIKGWVGREVTLEMGRRIFAIELRCLVTLVNGVRGFDVF